MVNSMYKHTNKSELIVLNVVYNVPDYHICIGNPEQWRWFVPHDVPGLVSLFKSNSSFISHLSEFFEGSMKYPSNFLPNPYYWYNTLAIDHEF